MTIAAEVSYCHAKVGIYAMWSPDGQALIRVLRLLGGQHAPKPKTEEAQVWVKNDNTNIVVFQGDPESVVDYIRIFKEDQTRVLPHFEAVGNRLFLVVNKVYFSFPFQLPEALFLISRYFHVSRERYVEWANFLMLKRFP
jgi:hypothetical protein